MWKLENLLGDKELVAGWLKQVAAQSCTSRRRGIKFHSDDPPGVTLQRPQHLLSVVGHGPLEDVRSLELYGSPARRQWFPRAVAAGRRAVGVAAVSSGSRRKRSAEDRRGSFVQSWRRVVATLSPARCVHMHGVHCETEVNPIKSPE